MQAQNAALEASPLARIAHGFDLLGRGQPDAALAAAESVLAGAPDCPDGLVLRGAALKAAGRYGEAVAAFRSALVLQPERPAVLVSLANAHAEQDELAEAEACLRRALALAPRLRAAHASLISVYAMRGDAPATEAACRDALAIDPHSAFAHRQLGELHAAAGRMEAARAHRDVAYRRQNLFVEPATRQAAPTALVLLTAEDGNIPLRYLLSRDRYTVVKWLIEYAAPGQAIGLPHHDFVFNAIGEPELPAATHAAAERFRRDGTAPFLNRPDRVARTSRTRLPVLLGDLADVVVPRAIRWTAGEAPPALGWPVLVRPVGSHGGAGLVRADSAEAFASAAAPHAACDVTAFVDYASADGLFRKYRMIFIDRRPLPYHLAIGDGWLVHYISANMLGEPARRLEERRFLDDPAGALGAWAHAALAAIAARLDLDYAGIDFSVLPDGRVLVFEANATMVVHPETPGGMLDYKNPAVRAILAAFDAMAVPGRGHGTPVDAAG